MTLHDRVAAVEDNAVQQWLLDSERIFRDSTVDVLVDGAEYFEQWFDSVSRVIHTPSPPRRVLHYAWRLTDVARGGKEPHATGIVAMLRQAASSSVEVRVSVSGHAWGVIAIAPPIWWRLRRSNGVQVLVDRTMRTVVQSNHVKLAVFEAGEAVWALLGSVDLTAPRFDRAHERDDPRRYHAPRGPSHELGIRIDGPAAVEIQCRFAARWSSVCAPPHRHRVRQVSARTPAVALDESRSLPAVDPGVTSALQVVETIPSTDAVAAPADSYGRLLRRAIDVARYYIYIEDQYFAPDLLDTDRGRRGIHPGFDILTALLDALRRGVCVIVLLPGRARGRQNPVSSTIERRRDRAIWKLRSHGGSGELVTLQYALPTHPVYIHSKLVVCDDEFMLVGSANICRRGVLSDRELAVGIVDPSLVMATRQRLWAEHAGLDESEAYLTTDWPRMLAALRASRRLTAYTVDAEPPRLSALESWFIDRIIDPMR